MTRPTELFQLAGSWQGRALPPGAVAEEKIDGWRAGYIRGRDGKLGLFTRNGHPIEGIGHIMHRLGQMEEVAGTELFFDGEFQVDGTLAATKHWCETGWKQGGEAGAFYVFDCFTRAEWEVGGSNVPQNVRRARLQALCASTPADQWDWRAGSRGRDEGRECVFFLPQLDVFTVADAVRAAQYVWSRGGEGLMLKNSYAPYRRNRTKDWQKVKQGQAWIERLGVAA